MRNAPFLPVWLMLFLGFASVGCRPPDDIVRYSIEKQSLVEARTKSRLLGAIVPNGNKAWFFKAVGPSTALAAQREAFEKFIQAVKFKNADADADPEWELPDGWSTVPAAKLRDKAVADMRFATLQIGSETHPVEIAVSSLPRPPGDWDAYVLTNVNRWRGQMQLKDLEAGELWSQVQRMSGSDTVLVDFEGRFAPRSMSGGGPFAGGPMSGGPAGLPGPSAAGPAVKLAYDTPEGWKPGNQVSSRGGITVRYDAAFDVVDGNDRFEVTVSSFPGAAANPLGNINRWRGQIGLPPVTEEELEKQLTSIDVGNTPGEYVEMLGPEGERREMILGVIVVAHSKVWFVKARGDVALARRETERFKAFVRSLKFEE